MYYKVTVKLEPSLAVKCFTMCMVRMAHSPLYTVVFCIVSSFAMSATACNIY